MTTFTRFMAALFAFGAVVGVVYWALTGELVGVMLLLGFSVMPILIGLFAYRHGRTSGEAASDDPEADPGAGAGRVLGTFPTASVWPIFLVLGVLLIGAGLIYGLILLAPGAALFIWSITGLARESRG
jgi:hypothetical protein